MKNEQEPTGEERELFELFSRSSLNDYPNPQRIGCPGEVFIKQLAADRKSVPLTDPRLDHVIHCSPCFQEFAAIRDGAHRPPNTTASRKAALICLAVAAAVIFGLWARGTLVSHRYDEANKDGAPMLAQISLQDRSMVRGAPNDPEKMKALHLPRGRLKLTVVLPFGSEAGTYEIQILRDIENPLLTAASKAELVDGITKLTVAVNTEPLVAGRYLFGVRKPPFDWTYNRVTIE